MFDLEEMNNKLKLDLAQTRADCENMLQIMEDNEVRINTHEKKEKLIAQLSEESRRRIEEALLEKDRLHVKE